MSILRSQDFVDSVSIVDIIYLSRLMKMKLQYNSITSRVDTKCYVTIVRSELSCYNKNIKIEEILIQHSCNNNNINPFNDLERIMNEYHYRSDNYPIRIAKIDNRGVKTITIDIYNSYNEEDTSDVSLLKSNGLRTSTVLEMIDEDHYRECSIPDGYIVETFNEETTHYFNHNGHCVRVIERIPSIIVDSMSDQSHISYSKRDGGTISTTVDTNHPVWVVLNQFKNQD